jgi:hypothetical protein
MTTANQPEPGAELTIDIDGQLKASENLTDSTAQESGGGSVDSEDTSPLRMAFTVQYTDMGLERLYEELACQKSDLDRTRHVKRCLIGIVRGDFKRPEASQQLLGETDRESYKIQIRLSSRDIGLEAIYGELKQLKTSFARNHAIRRKLYDAFNRLPSPVQPSGISTATWTTALEPTSGIPVFGVPSKPMVPSRVDRREATDEANAALFNFS